jgi:hypothetical protein
MVNDDVKIYLVVILIVIGGSVALLIITDAPISDSITGNVVFNSDSKCRNVSVPYEIQEEYLKMEYYTETVPYVDTVCEDINLPYSITNKKWVSSSCLNENYVCYEDGFFGCKDGETFCVERLLVYSADINNLDLEESGVWKTSTNFYIGGELHETVPSSVNIYPQTTKTITIDITLTGDSPSGIANKAGRSAGFSVTSIPIKKICEDVTKYKEVERTKEVTAYRPVTKYTIKEECN